MKWFIELENARIEFNFVFRQQSFSPTAKHEDCPSQLANDGRKTTKSPLFVMRHLLFL